MQICCKKETICV